uniref:Uncharacterized protein n=1 Tax=Anguilla anguilla TaxID=7936 RepID=A0A0E9RXM6_ANGAN
MNYPSYFHWLIGSKYDGSPSTSNVFFFFYSSICCSHRV